jgi:hypothetical protein
MRRVLTSRARAILLGLLGAALLLWALGCSEPEPQLELPADAPSYSDCVHQPQREGCSAWPR